MDKFLTCRSFNSSQDAATESQEVKKQLREAVFKAALEISFLLRLLDDLALGPRCLRAVSFVYLEIVVDFLLSPAFVNRNFLRKSADLGLEPSPFGDWDANVSSSS